MKQYFKDYWKLLQFVKPFRGTLLLASICMAFSTLFEGVSIGLVIPVLDRIFTNKQIIIPGKLPEFLRHVVDRLNVTPQLEILQWLVIFMVVGFFLKGVFLYLQTYLMNIVGYGVVRDVRNIIYAKLQALSLDFYSSQRTGELISRITNDVSFITHALSYALTDLIYESMRAVFLTFLAFSLAIKMSWQLSIFSFVIFPLIMFPVIKIGKRVKKFTKTAQEKIADLNSHLAETINGAYIVKAYCREEYELNRFKDINQGYYKAMLRSIKRTIILPSLTEYIGVTGAAAILWIVGKDVIDGRISFGVFSMFIASLLSIMRPVKKLSNVHTSNQQALVASKRIYAILDEVPKVRDRDDAVNVKGFYSTIEFKDVSFDYEDGVPVLRGINFSVRKGETVAFVGHSGAGKSTLVNLLPRMYDITGGAVVIDGRNIKDYTLSSLRGMISVVSQEMVLFNATVRDNIGYGKAGANDEEIIAAAKKAHAWEFIKDMPQGLDTVIGDRGTKVSGGEKQRLSIARAMLKDSPILILDEATSNLDAKSEQLIKEGLYELLKNKTAFVIAHRLSTVQKANKIIVMDKGHITESGTHQELLAKGGVYKKLHDLQFNV